MEIFFGIVVVVAIRDWLSVWDCSQACEKIQITKMFVCIIAARAAAAAVVAHFPFFSPFNIYWNLLKRMQSFWLCDHKSLHSS